MVKAVVQWPEWQAALVRQNMAPARVVIMNSQSMDGMAEAAMVAGYQVVDIERSAFDHVGTRQRALLHVADNTESVVYLTQDAALARDDALRNIIVEFEDIVIGMAYGRQFPCLVGTAIEVHDSVKIVVADRRHMCSAARTGGVPSIIPVQKRSFRSHQEITGRHERCFKQDMVWRHTVLEFRGA